MIQGPVTLPEAWWDQRANEQRSSRTGGPAANVRQGAGRRRMLVAVGMEMVKRSITVYKSEMIARRCLASGRSVRWGMLFSVHLVQKTFERLATARVASFKRAPSAAGGAWHSDLHFLLACCSSVPSSTTTTSIKTPPARTTPPLGWRLRSWPRRSQPSYKTIITRAASAASMMR